jgi:hypothetical protein
MKNTAPITLSAIQRGRKQYLSKQSALYECIVIEDYEEGRSDCESIECNLSSELKGRKQYLSKQNALYECSD